MLRRLVTTLAATAATTAALAAGPALPARADVALHYTAGVALAPTVDGVVAGACTATAVGLVASATITCTIFDPDSGRRTTHTAAGPGTAVAPFADPFDTNSLQACYYATFTSTSFETKSFGGCSTLTPQVG